VLHPSRIGFGESACVAAMSRRTWAKPLKNKGDSVIFG